MAKYRQEYIFGLRAVIEAIQQEKEKLLKQHVQIKEQQQEKD